MEQHQQKPALVLKYAKRRFDGGSEIDLIRSIEVAQMNKLYSGPQTSVNPSFSEPLNLAAAPVAAPQPQPQAIQRTRQSRMLEAAMRGPLQICIGVVGMLTASLAVITFKQAKNKPMQEQSWALFHDCRKGLQKGLVDCLTTPTRVVQAGLKKV